MKTVFLPCLVGIAMLVNAQVSSRALGEDPPALGTTISDLTFTDIRTLPRSLNDLGKHRAYVFVFTTTQCPLVRRTMPKLAELHQRYTAQDVQFVAVNVGGSDSIRDMASQAIEFDVSFPFVKDTDLRCAKALGVTRTPGVAVLNGDRQLVYRGRIDDQHRLGGSRPEPSRRDLDEALQELLAGKPVSLPETPVDGCLISAPPPMSSDAPEPTFYRDVAPILYKRCAGCHRPNTAAPFSLLSFADAASQSEMLIEVIRDQRMPPWYAHDKFGTFQNDPSLTADERDTLIRWASSHRREGNPGDAPPMPEFPQSKWRIGEPDLVISMVSADEIPATGYLKYRHSILPYVFLADTWVESVEILPDNPSVVHHCNMAYVSPQGAGPQTFITGFVPGGQPLDLSRFAGGVAYRIPKYSALGLEIHYTTTGKPETCRISVGLRFPRDVVHKQFRHLLLDPRKLRIPPGHGAYPVSAEKELTSDVSLLGLFAHMHLRGKDMTFFANYPDGMRETLLQLPNYNFEWQLGYEIASGTKRLPAGTRLEAIAHYDNSAFNPYNPDPTRTVPWGSQTYDEMFNGFAFFVNDQEDLQLKVDPQTGRELPPASRDGESTGKPMAHGSDER